MAAGAFYLLLMQPESAVRIPLYPGRRTRVGGTSRLGFAQGSGPLGSSIGSSPDGTSTGLNPLYVTVDDG